MATQPKHTIAHHVEEIRSQGYTIVEDVLSSAEVVSLSADLQRIESEEKIVPHKNFFEGENTIRIYNLLVYGAPYVRISEHQRILPIVEAILGRECLISSLSSIRILPGEKAQPIHADDQAIPITKPHAPIVCNSMWAISDFSAANGATRILPGSQLRDHNPSFGTAYESVAAEMRAGSVMVYDGSMWHGGGANTSSEARTGIAMNYCAGYIRQQESQLLGVPQDLVRTLPKRVRELIGYSVYRGLIGHVNHAHPQKILTGKANSD